jgi:hypothetical protein
MPPEKGAKEVQKRRGGIPEPAGLKIRAMGKAKTSPIAPTGTRGKNLSGRADWGTWMMKNTSGMSGKC